MFLFFPEHIHSNSLRSLTLGKLRYGSLKELGYHQVEHQLKPGFNIKKVFKYQHYKHIKKSRNALACDIIIIMVMENNKIQCGYKFFNNSWMAQLATRPAVNR